MHEKIWKGKQKNRSGGKSNGLPPHTQEVRRTCEVRRTYDL
jgi:hypothetical protein